MDMSPTVSPWALRWHNAHAHSTDTTCCCATTTALHCDTTEVNFDFITFFMIFIDVWLKMTGQRLVTCKEFNLSVSNMERATIIEGMFLNKTMTRPRLRLETDLPYDLLLKVLRDTEHIKRAR